jgi:hypothetical protein
MCFCLYLGSSKNPETILFQAPARGVWAGRLHKHDNPVREKFSLPCVSFLGSDQGCGCGFRNESTQDGITQTQPNHQSLVTFLKAHFSADTFVELYSCMWGEFSQAVAAQREIDLSQLAQADFRFDSRAYYRVRL